MSFCHPVLSPRKFESRKEKKSKKLTVNWLLLVQSLEGPFQDFVNIDKASGGDNRSHRVLDRRS
jgi:hypothetical protein